VRRTVKMTAAQALVWLLHAQRTVVDGVEVPLFAGVWAIFGHGNVAGIGEALYDARDKIQTFRAHNEQAMGLAAVAFAKASRRRRMMAVTTSIGPGATNLVTAAAVAHVNRLPVLLIPGDVFAGRAPDPVLQQVEGFADGTVSANDCLRPVSRYFDRITRPEQVGPAFLRAMTVLTDPATCGPATLAFCQDVQAMAYDYPIEMFAARVWRFRRPAPDVDELANAVARLRDAKRPLIVAGGGVLYSQAETDLAAFATRHGIPVVETNAGKSSLPAGHSLNLGAVGVTGTAASNEAARAADVVLAVGTRLADFSSGSRALFRPEHIVSLNVQPLDAALPGSVPFVADARVGLAALDAALPEWTAPAGWTAHAMTARREWLAVAARYLEPGNATLPSDAQVIGAVQRGTASDAIVVSAAGGLPGELHKHWQAARPGGFHLEYGYSCMGYEIAGGVGVAMACPDRDVVVMVGDGSYLMMNSEIATAVMLGLRLTVVVLDNRGYACIDRLQRRAGGAGFNNLLRDAHHATLPSIDFAAHAASLGAVARKASSVGELEQAMRDRSGEGVAVFVIDTDPETVTDAGGAWWDVAIPEVSKRPQVRAARARYDAELAKRNGA